jgi:phospho-N-acetylmuramoyl-pentapeptide-transferase
MGGLVILGSVIVAYLTSHLLAGSDISSSALLVMGMGFGLGLLGLLDDWLKISKQRSLGLTAKQKLLGQVVIAAAFGVAGLHFVDKYGLAPISRHLSTVRDTSLILGSVVVVIWVVLLIMGSSNAVNLTDGLDGLASGAAIMAFLAFVLIGIWEFRQSCAYTHLQKCYEVRDPLDMAVLAAAFAGSCAGFLWWNTSPAKIFMGDVGSLALGGAIAGLAITLENSSYCSLHSVGSSSSSHSLSSFKFSTLRQPKGSDSLRWRPFNITLNSQVGAR